MIAALGTVRSLIVAVLVVASATATVAFRPGVVEDAAPFAAELRFDTDDVRVRERSSRTEKDLEREALEALRAYQPIGCQMRTDPAIYAGLFESPP